jgi:hypothetical protein
MGLVEVLAPGHRATADAAVVPRDLKRRPPWPAPVPLRRTRITYVGVLTSLADTLANRDSIPPSGDGDLPPSEVAG